VPPGEGDVVRGNDQGRWDLAQGVRSQDDVQGRQPGADAEDDRAWRVREQLPDDGGEQDDGEENRALEQVRCRLPQLGPPPRYGRHRARLLFPRADLRAM
jgi:hypothetical protein